MINVASILHARLAWISSLAMKVADIHAYGVTLISNSLMAQSVEDAEISPTQTNGYAQILLIHTSATWDSSATRPLVFATKVLQEMDSEAIKLALYIAMDMIHLSQRQNINVMLRLVSARLAILKTNQDVRKTERKLVIIVKFHLVQLKILSLVTELISKTQFARNAKKETKDAHHMLKHAQLVLHHKNFINVMKRQSLVKKTHKVSQRTFVMKTAHILLQLT